MENEFKGTKGKLRVVTVHDDTGTIDIKDENNNRIVTLWRWNKGVNIMEPHEQNANAMLFSKAPEMLEKLIEIDTALKHNTFKENESYFRSIVEKLIKEATAI